jgi:hypothetical protein
MPALWRASIQVRVKMPEGRTGIGLTLLPVLIVESVYKSVQLQGQLSPQKGQICKRLPNNLNSELAPPVLEGAIEELLTRQ